MRHLDIKACQKTPLVGSSNHHDQIYRVTIHIGNTIGGSDRNQVYKVIPTVKTLYLLGKPFAHICALSQAKKFELSKILYGTIFTSENVEL
mgnify:CR=1 FL=1